MRILITSDDYYPQVGGISRLLHSIAVEMQEQHHDIMVISCKQSEDIIFDSNQPIKIKRLPAWLFSTPLWTFFLCWQIYCFKPQVIINGNWKSAIHIWLVSFFIKKIPYYIFAYGAELIEGDYTLRRIVRRKFDFIKKSVFKRSELTFVISEHTMNILIQQNIPKVKLRMVHPGVDVRKFYPTNRSIKLANNLGLKQEKIILSVSRIVPHKGHDIVIRALPEVIAKIKNVKYLIVGEGPYQQYLQQLAVNLGVSDYILFIGRVSDENLQSYYNLASIFVQISREVEVPISLEGFGITFLEASACGIPVLGGNSGGVSDAVLQGKTGFLVNPTSPKECAKFLVLLLSDNQLSKRMGTYGLQRVNKNFNLTLVTKRILMMLKNSLK